MRKTKEKTKLVRPKFKKKDLRNYGNQIITNTLDKIISKKTKTCNGLITNNELSKVKIFNLLDL